MAATIGVEAGGKAMLGEYLQQPSKRRCSALLLDKKRRIDVAGRVIHRHDQVELRLILKPSKAAAILVQHHAHARLARPLATVRAAPRSRAHETSRMQLCLHPRVAPAEIMLLLQVLVKML